jgi:hypothetical protein
VDPHHGTDRRIAKDPQRRYPSAERLLDAARELEQDEKER